MRSPYPFTLSVHWQAGRRATERQRARQRYRRIWGVQRGREMRLKAPDPEASEREREAAELNRELTATAGAGVYQVAITLALTHPDGNAVELQRHARELERDLLARTDARLHHPVFAQMPAWRSTWPLSHDPLRITRKYVTANLADTTPLVAARCGSPSGIPLGWARPGRTLERLDPFDPVAREPPDGHRRQVRRREDDVDEPDPRANPRARRERWGDRPRRALRVPRLADPRRDLPQPRHPHGTGDQPVGHRRPPRGARSGEARIPPRAAQLLPRPPAPGRHLRPRTPRPLPALPRDPRRVPPLPADRRAAPRSAAAGGALPPLRGSPQRRQRRARRAARAARRGPARLRRRRRRQLSRRPAHQRARRLAAGDLRHPRRRRRARRRSDVHDRRAPRPPQPPHP